MKISEFAKLILFGKEISQKLIHPEDIEFDDFDEKFMTPSLPARASSIKFSDKNIKFPRGHFHLNDKKAIALHSFANHELLACEMMAAALLKYPHHTEELKKFKRGILSSLIDEQKHFRLYVERLNEIGYEFGDFDLNDFFWNQMQKMETPSQYLAVMSLTFEAANLDFAAYYRDEFLKVDDKKTADILEIVLKEEISHVAFGATYLNKWREDKTLWEYYIDNLPAPLTPARSKGKYFLEDYRKKSKLDEDFINSLRNFDDGFFVTARKEWKK